MTQRSQRETRMIEQFPKGAVVRVKDPDGYISSVASKMRDRLGEITGHQMPTPNPIVTFYAVGRKKEYRKVFSYCTERDLEIVTDPALIEAWRRAVEDAKARSTKNKSLKF